LCDTSIRPGWFYHPDQDDRVKSPQELVDLYYRSVGRNCVLLLNVPPDREGHFHETDVAALRGFRRILDETFARDLAAGARAEADNVRLSSPKFAAANVADQDPDTYWSTDDDVRGATLEIALSEPVEFDRILLQEPIRFGQRVASFRVEARIDGAWRPVGEGTTIGYKRLLRLPVNRSDGVRIVIEDALGPPALSRIGLFKASPDESLP